MTQNRVPVHFPGLKNFYNVNPGTDPKQIIWGENGHGLSYQVIYGGYLRNMSFADIVNTEVNNTKQYLTQNHFMNPTRSFLNHREHKENGFAFVLYFVDLLMPVDTRINQQRQLCVYMYDPVNRDYYQITLTAGPFLFPSKHIKTGRVDLENDEVSALLDNMMTEIMKNITHEEVVNEQ